jgi:threonine aldolase
VFNATAALGISVAELTAGVDTVMFCLSKGLGAPVGSMLVGSAEAMARARLYRKALGGGMRQAGILAAAGLIALEEMPARLGEDHANVRLLAEAAADGDAAEIDMASVQTNMVIFKLKKGGDAAAFCAALKEKGVLAGEPGGLSAGGGSGGGCVEGVGMRVPSKEKTHDKRGDWRPAR